MMNPPKEEPAFRANERPAQTKETNNTSKVNTHSAKGKRSLSLLDRLLVAIFDTIGGLALWFLKGGSR